MTSEVSICNLALSHLGDEATVASIDPPEGSAQAEHCATFFSIARKALLEMHPWNFAKRRVALVALDITPPDSWVYAYQYPNSCVTPLKVLLPGQTDGDDTDDFVTETEDSGNRVIYTSAEDAVLVYTALVEDPTKYSALFINALSRLLASYLAGPIIKGTTGINVSKEHLNAFLKVEYPLAVAHDGRAHKKQSGKTYENFLPSALAARR